MSIFSPTNEEEKSYAASAPRRIQISRRRGWRMPPNAVKVDRSTRWGNPFAVGAAEHGGIPFADGPLTAERAVALYRGMVEAKLRDHPDMLEPLRGRDLACWCPFDQPCHADVLLDLANRPRGAEGDAA